MLERMEAGMLNVFGHLHDWFEEFAIYHRKRRRDRQRTGPVS